METQEKRETEKLKQEPRVNKALKESAKKDTPQDEEEEVIEKKDKQAIGGYLILLIAAGLAYFIFKIDLLNIPDKYNLFIEKITGIFLIVVVVLMISRLLRAVLEKRLDNATTQYNLNRIIHLATSLILFFIILSGIFINWYATVVSLGLISLILGLALQNPITSFFAWIYILIRKPYEVGDRIKIGNATGDVIGLSYFDTTLWEVNGDYLSGDHPSGRVIRFANSKVFNEYVFNYSWPLFPYSWNEIKLFIGYNSDLHFVGATLKALAENEVGEAMMHRVRLYRNILAETPIDELEVREKPSVIFRAHDNTWMEVVVRYLVHPKEAGKVKNHLFKSMVQALNQHPEKVSLPNTGLP